MKFYSESLWYRQLNNSETKVSTWKNGRCWIQKDNTYNPNNRELSIEWGFGKFSKHLHAKLMFGEGDSDNSVTITVSIPYIFYIYFTINNIYRCKAFQTGISIYDNCINIYPITYTNMSNSSDPWYRRMFYLDFPWKYVLNKVEILSLDKSKVICIIKNNTYSYNYTRIIRNLASITYPYKYITKRGDIQKVNATVYIERITHNMKWVPFIKKQYIILNIRFDGEIGERVGTWKGGAIACSYEMLTHENAEQCLRRMEKERKF